MSADEEFVQERYPTAYLSRIPNPLPDQDVWEIKAFPELGAVLLGSGLNPARAWANAREQIGKKQSSERAIQVARHTFDTALFATDEQSKGIIGDLKTVLEAGRRKVFVAELDGSYSRLEIADDGKFKSTPIADE